MKKWIMVALLTLNLSVPCLVENLRAADLEVEFQFSNGYRVDDFDWNIASDFFGSTPNIFSELTWRDLEIIQVTGGVQALINNVFYMRGSIGAGYTLDGDNQDSDYSGDNRTLEWSRSNNSSDDSYVLDATVGLGYQFRLLSGRLRFIPLVGYAYNEQNLRLKDGLQTVSVPALAPPPSVPSPLGPIAGLDSTYDTRWYGPWLGVDLFFKASDKLKFFGGFEYHWADYEAEANWNLRADLAHPDSFEHYTDGTGFLISVGGEYLIFEPWSLGLEIDYQEWSTDDGVDRTFLAAGTAGDTRLNEVNWESFAIMLKLTYRFRFFYSH